MAQLRRRRAALAQILLKPARELFVLRGPDLVGRFHAHPVQQRGEVVAGLLRRIFLRGDVAEHLKEEVPGLVQEGRAVRVLERSEEHTSELKSLMSISDAA